MTTDDEKLKKFLYREIWIETYYVRSTMILMFIARGVKLDLERTDMAPVCQALQYKWN